MDNFKRKLMSLFKTVDLIHIEYRIKTGEDYRWHSFIGNSEINNDGSATLYCIIYDINGRVEYEIAMEQIAFDISHVLRRPVTTLLGLSNLIESEENISNSKLKEYVGYVKNVSQEMDEYTRNLNKIYQKKKELINDMNNWKKSTSN